MGILGFYEMSRRKEPSVVVPQGVPQALRNFSLNTRKNPKIPMYVFTLKTRSDFMFFFLLLHDENGPMLLGMFIVGK